MNKNKLAKAGFSVFTAITLLLVCFIGFLAVTQTKPYAVVTDSMSPAINKGDAVFTRRVNPSELRTGDIVTVNFNDGSGSFTHRIVRIDTKKSLIYTKGDNSPNQDPKPSAFSQIVGRMWFSVPLLGSLSMALGSKNFLVSIAIIAVLLVSARIIITARKKAKAGGGKDAA
jgi:signal peptidase I